MASVILYDSQLQPNSTPNNFRWATSWQDANPYLTDYSTSGATQAVTTIETTETATRLSTNLDNNYPNLALAGYSNYGLFLNNLINPTFPILNRGDGFSLKFRLRLNAESHSGERNADNLDDRAGFSVIVISSDGLGIELGFWTGEIWAQSDGTGSPLFTHSPSERAFLDTTTWSDYQLKFEADHYILSAESATQGTRIILQGKLKDYSAFDHQQAGLPYDPYEQANFIFLGDNSRSASSAVDLQAIGIQTNSSELQPPNDSTVHASVPGAGLLAGTAQPDRFQFLRPDPFGALGADTITQFNGLQGDRLQFSHAVLPGVDRLSLKTVRSSKAFKRALRSEATLIYQPRTGEVVFNANGRRAGWGERGGLLAILEGSPPLQAAHLELLGP